MKYKNALTVCLIVSIMLLFGCSSSIDNSDVGIINVTPNITAEKAYSTEAEETPALSFVPSSSSADEISPAVTASASPMATLKLTAVPSASPFSTPKQTSKYEYEIHINRVQNCVTVYKIDGNGKYSIPYKAFICSTGDATPLGTFHTTDKYVWRALFGDVYGQYATRITGTILFHSVPYRTQHKNDLEYEEYNKLGTAASMGCIRLTCADAKWIYDNCPKGTTVVIYDDADLPGDLGKPDFIHIDPNDERRGWDPTDPDPGNPWRGN